MGVFIINKSCTLQVTIDLSHCFYLFILIATISKYFYIAIANKAII